MKREIDLRDGRVLDAWVDVRDGEKPLVFHFGTPSSGLPYAPFVELAHERGLGWVSWSRPGYGSSTRFEDRRVADIVTDARGVLSSIGASRAYILGWSGGGPHALACAALMPEQVMGVTCIAGVAPYDAAGLDFLEGMGEENIVEFGAAVQGPRALDEFLDQAWPLAREVAGTDVVKSLGDLVDDADKRALTGGYADWLADNMRGGLRDSYGGWMDDDLALVAPWGFDLNSFEVPVHIWQGDCDRMVPFAHGQWLVRHCRRACPHLLEGHGHASIGVDQFGAILDEMLGGS